MDERVCTKCGTSKPRTPEHFARHKRLGFRPECKSCQHVAHASYRDRNRESLNAKAATYRAARREELAHKQREYHHANRDFVLAQMRASTLKHEYGLSPEQYTALLVAQGGSCAICGTEPKRKALFVDHDHVTGKVRGLLCPPCNSAIGALGDSEAGLLRAMEYLRTANERVTTVLPDGPAFTPRAHRYP